MSADLRLFAVRITSPDGTHLYEYRDGFDRAHGTDPRNAKPYRFRPGIRRMRTLTEIHRGVSLVELEPLLYALETEERAS